MKRTKRTISCHLLGSVPTGASLRHDAQVPEPLHAPGGDLQRPPLKLQSASGRRVLSVGDGAVRFQYRDYADHKHSKEMTLPAAELLRRFLLHVVPRGFMRIRHYGATANHHRERKLTRARELGHRGTGDVVRLVTLLGVTERE
jgi:Putative transposase